MSDLSNPVTDFASSILTPAGTLVAYSLASSPTTLRSQATLAATIWSSYNALASSNTLAAGLPKDPASDDASTSQSDSSSPDRLKTLEFELSSGQVVLCRLRSHLLLCLVGPTALSPPSTQSSVHSPSRSPSSHEVSLPTSVDSAATPSQSPPPPPPRAHSSTGTWSQNGLGEKDKVATLRLLRTQANTLAEWLNTELDGFEMPTGS